MIQEIYRLSDEQVQHFETFRKPPNRVFGDFDRIALVRGGNGGIRHRLGPSV